MTPIIGFTDAQHLKLMEIRHDHFERVASVSITRKFVEVFDKKKGTLPGTHHLKPLDEFHLQ